MIRTGRPIAARTFIVLTEEAAEVLKTYGTPGFKKAIAEFIEQFGSLKTAYERCVRRTKFRSGLPDGSTVYLSPGEHNALQVAIIEEFGPRFAPGAEVLYVGDTAKKHVIFERDQLARLGVPITEHDKLPDIVLYDPAKQWLFMIEAVTSHGPVSPKRHREIESFLGRCHGGAGLCDGVSVDHRFPEIRCGHRLGNGSLDRGHARSHDSFQRAEVFRAA